MFSLFHWAQNILYITSNLYIPINYFWWSKYQFLQNLKKKIQFDPLTKIKYTSFYVED